MLVGMTTLITHTMQSFAECEGMFTKVQAGCASFGLCQ
jgi:hypothetical protein